MGGSLSSIESHKSYFIIVIVLLKYTYFCLRRQKILDNAKL
ncbi:hypothetical protein M23134_08134 [Microscilla marina ATCC 23134]|uniref:Uncharacterized protein n=1 Tax=Microscilla marina ATCC 23134 TaxID=313606 RepID=A1ZH40_MICM2|nr:hypothetical protein M23134_08134 [Microscilla marina ATCC 23134]